MRSQRRKKARGGRWASALLLPFLVAILGMAALVASALLVAAAGAAGAGGGFEEAWRAYEEAVARGATPGELRELAQAAYDALAVRPAKQETMLRKAEAALQLGRLDYRTGDAQAAVILLEESDKLSASCQGRIDPFRCMMTFSIFE